MKTAIYPNGWRLGAAVAAAVLVLIQGCTGGGSSSSRADALAINFEARVGDAPYSCAADGAVAPFGDTTIAPGGLRFFVHDVELILADGTVTAVKPIDDGFWQTDSVGLLDFEDGTARCRGGTGETNTKLVVEKPSAAVTGIAFKIGVPFAENHADPAKASGPLTYTSMHWSWKAGYKFLRLDGKTAAGEPYGLHMGSTGCEGGIGDVTSCARPNRVKVEFTEFDPARQTLVLDIAEMVSADADETGGSKIGCLGEKTEPGCVPVFRQLGLDFESGRPAGRQLVFSVR